MLRFKNQKNVLALKNKNNLGMFFCTQMHKIDMSFVKKNSYF